MNIKFGHIEIFVKEPLKSKDFYMNVLGFELIEVQHEKVVWLQSNGQTILLRPSNNNYIAETYQQTNIALVIYVEDLEKALKDMTGKGVVFKGNDGVNCYTFTDLDGNWIQLVDPNHV